MCDEARQSADALRTKRMEALQREQQTLSDEITRRTREELFAIARKTLADLADTSLESRITDVFARRVRELTGETKQNLVQALTSSSGPALIRSAFPLTAEQQSLIQQALDETFATQVSLRFMKAPEVISGIEFTASGRKIAWSIDEYLASLGQSVEELLKTHAQAATSPAAKSEGGP